jgi:hypothetical protein
MTFRVVERASVGDVVTVFERLSPARAAEATASSHHDDPQFLAHELLLLRQGSPPGHVGLWALCDDFEPLAICGFVQFGPGLAGMIWAATPAWPRLALSSHRWWRRTFVPQVLCRFRRVEFCSLAEDLSSRRWLKRLGFTEEGIAYRQGKRGEDFVHMAWVNH